MIPKHHCSFPGALPAFLNHLNEEMDPKNTEEEVGNILPWPVYLSASNFFLFTLLEIILLVSYLEKDVHDVFSELLEWLCYLGSVPLLFQLNEKPGQDGLLVALGIRGDSFSYSM